MTDAKTPSTNEKPRLLVLGAVEASQDRELWLNERYRVEIADEPEDALEQLREGHYDAVLADAGQFLPLERGLVGETSSLVLDTIGEGVCVVNTQGTLIWSNRRVQNFTTEVIHQVTRICRQALQIFNADTGGLIHRDSDPTPRRVVRSKKFTLQVDQRFFEIICSPVLPPQGPVDQVVGVVWDATNSKRLQSKIDAIDAAGRELARLDGEQLAKLAPTQRLQVLQDKIIKFSKDLMHFDHFAIRVLDKRSGKLEVVIAEGLPPEALEIDLYAQPEGNGISGYVAATGRSYICHDTEKDPRYVLGLQHSKSSLTVPLMLFDDTIGVYNIESEQVGAFTEDDRQFAEIFGRYVGLALNILNLLVVERYTTSHTITDSVMHEMAQPLDEVLAESQGLRDRLVASGQDDQAESAALDTIEACVDRIRNVLRQIRQGPTAVIGSHGDEAQNPPDDSLLGKRILVADDESNIRQTIKGVLSRRGCEVEICKDGYEACALLDRSGEDGFDLVISDIRMPYRNGYEIFAAAQRANVETPVLLMTGFGYDPHHSIVRASTQGLAGVLFKPFKVDHFLEEVRKAIGAATAVSEAT